MDQNTLEGVAKYTLRIAHTEEGWILPLRDAVKDVPYETAKWKPASEVASIWEIVAHAIPYTESRLRDFTGESGKAEQDWPKVEGGTAEEWKALQQRVVEVTTRLQSTLEGADEDALFGKAPGKESPRIFRLMDIAIHDAYHAGQIVKLTQLHSATA